MKKKSKPAPYVAFYWASQVSSISFEIVLFVLLGYWADRRWGTAPVLLLSGCVVGLLAAFWHLWRLVRAFDRAGKNARGAE